MPDIAFMTGVLGGTILVAGAAVREGKVKNALLGAGTVFMFVYALMNFWAGGTVLFVFFESLALLATLLMVIDLSDKWDTLILGTGGLILVGLSLAFSQTPTTLFFIVGLTGVSLGYALKEGTVKRHVAFTLGAALICLFSYFEANWIFFWLNVFFAGFSGWHFYKVVTSS